MSKYECDTNARGKGFLHPEAREPHVKKLHIELVLAPGELFDGRLMLVAFFVLPIGE